MADSITDDGKEKFIRPEPLGYIDTNYQRFYIHFTSMKKIKSLSHEYEVKGKTRVKDHICDFTGTIVITSAQLKDNCQPGIDSFIWPGCKEGKITADVYLKEKDSEPYSGFIKGRLKSDFVIDGNGTLLYDAISIIGDGFYNNQCEATWTSYKTHLSKKCNWGDFRIPDSKGFDWGDGEFSPNDKYVKNGWESYQKAYGGSKSREEYVAAVKEEFRKWWK